MADKIKAVVLAAGRSTRMKSERSKVLHPILGREIIRYLLDSLAACGLAEEDIVIVVGDNRAEIEKASRQALRFRAAERAAGHGPRPAVRDRGAGRAPGRSPGAGRGQSLHHRRRAAETHRRPPRQPGPVHVHQRGLSPRLRRPTAGSSATARGGSAPSWKKRTPAPSSGRSVK